MRRKKRARDRENGIKGLKQGAVTRNNIKYFLFKSMSIVIRNDDEVSGRERD